MDSDALKIKRIREYLNLTQSQFAAKCGVKQQLIAMFERGQRTPTTAFKLGFLKAFHTDFDDQILESDVLKLGEPAPNSLPPNLAPVPFYSAKVAAGLGAELPTYPEKDILYFDKRLLNNVVGIKEANAVILQAEGDSMDSGMNKPNDIRNGDLLMIDVSQKEIVNNKPYVVELNNSELVVKKVVKEWNGIIMLVSNNPLYPARPVTAENEAKIVGRVVWNVSKENV